eukprot:4064709-Karenia_brevis.AAC.1
MASSSWFTFPTVHQASPEDEWKGCRPWRLKRHRTTYTEEQGLVQIVDPDGRCCAICNNVFRILSAPSPLLLRSIIACICNTSTHNHLHQIDWCIWQQHIPCNIWGE